MLTRFLEHRDWSTNSSGIKNTCFDDPFAYKKDQFVADHPFHNLFQVDFCNFVILGKKSNSILGQRSIYWQACRGM